MPSLENAQGVYSFWGKRPSWYQLACLVTFLGREEELRKKAVEKLKLKPGNTVLDLACGTGLNFSYLQEAVGENGKIVGFDYSKEMLNAARGRVESNCWRNVELIPGDAAELSLKYQVDGVLSTLGISAIRHHKEALEKLLGNLEVEEFNGGTIYLASGTKKRAVN